MRTGRLYFWLACAASLCSGQEPYAPLQLDRSGFERRIQDYVHQAMGREDQIELPPLPGAKFVLAMNDAARAALVRDCGAAAKAFVMSAAFQVGYDAYIKGAYRAVNHGIQVSTAEADLEAAIKKGDRVAMREADRRLTRERYREGVLQRLPSLANYDAGTIKTMAAVDKGQMDSSGASTTAEKEAVAKAKAMVDEAVQLASTDIAKARETYKAAMLLSAGVQNEGQTEAAADSKLMEEQRRYEERRLQPNLKKALLAFAVLAKSVDFQAATVMKGGKRVFVNPAYERKSDVWKMLYRLGPGGTNAAIRIAQQWAAEL